MAEKVIERLKVQGKNDEARIVFAYLECLDEISKKYPILVKHRAESAERFIKYLRQDAVERLSGMSDEEMRKKIRSALERAVETGLMAFAKILSVIPAWDLFWFR